MNSLPMLLQILHIALDHIIHIYMIQVMRFVLDLVCSPEYRFAQDAAHINQRFLTICVTFLYNGKDSTIHTTFVVIL